MILEGACPCRKRQGHILPVWSVKQNRELTKHEFSQVLLVATGVAKPDGKMVYGFGRTDPNATYGGDDIFSNDGTDVFHVVGGIDLLGYQKVLVSSSLPGH